MGNRDIWDEEAESEQAKAAAKPHRRQVAVALSDDPDNPGLPTVTASGRGAVAEQILQLAFAHGVKVRTDPDLAEVLAAVEVDTVIPVEAFVAVAEILAYVYRANAAMGEPPPPGGAA
ncbi:EscU/YscU/HrcU family type III secretion system export apparatus switch protein [Magnetospirillum sp. 15-1]|uniref:EscU/YscU/HrcU family type III secretion system export apparatus switch protein n=1 Tax=Magnetospirillum sp. 15-1 TaxID=1979370 RepID=UPI000BBBD156|nr:EscU/YscU/HrcU family type III secretion system export apparatus switch protein [Magnetospirillum sp. 15-1]